MTLTSTQQALLLGLWSVTDLSYAIYTTLLSAVEIDNWKQTVWPEFVWVQLFADGEHVHCIWCAWGMKAQLFDWGCSVHSDLLVLGIHFTYWRSQETWRFILYNNSIRSAAVTWKRGFFVSRVSNNHFLQSKLPPVVHVSDNVCRVFARRFYQTLFIQDRTVYCSVCEIQSWLKQTGDDLL